jgi:hypothetical protein
MPAYHVPLYRQCSDEHCSKPATHEVRNRYGERVRDCCRRHADLLVIALDAP